MKKKEYTKLESKIDNAISHFHSTVDDISYDKYHKEKIGYIKDIFLSELSYIDDFHCGMLLIGTCHFIITFEEYDIEIIDFKPKLFIAVKINLNSLFMEIRYFRDVILEYKDEIVFGSQKSYEIIYDMLGKFYNLELPRWEYPSVSNRYSIC